MFSRDLAGPTSRDAIDGFDAIADALDRGFDPAHGRSSRLGDFIAIAAGWLVLGAHRPGRRQPHGFHVREVARPSRRVASRDEATAGVATVAGGGGAHVVGHAVLSPLRLDLDLDQ